MKASAAVLAAVLLALAAGAAEAQVPYASAVEPVAGASACPGGLCGTEALGGLFEALAASEAGTRERPVHILQIGDSHTAGDRITGKLRAEFQRRFGHGGRGVLPAGVPYAGYAPYQVEVETRGWATETATLQPVARRPSAAFGLGAVRGQAVPGAELVLRFEPGAEAVRVGACGWPRGSGDGLEIDPGDDAPWPVDLNGSDRGEPACYSFELARPAAAVTLRGVGAGVVLDTVWTERVGRGVVVSSLGLTGSTLRDLADRNDALIGLEIGSWAPAMIVLAYGTNEGFDDAMDAVAYERLLRGQVDRLRGMAPYGTSFLILGAPDALRNGVADGCSADRRRAPPPSLAVVRDVQRRVAADMGVAFWDWHGRMGGECSADRLATMGEPLMRGDRVHFSSTGADWIGGVLSADLMAAYDAWKAAREGAE